MEEKGSFIQQHSDVLVAAVLIMIVLMMIIPLPTMLLDILLCVNITLSLVIVLVTIYNSDALDFSVFPSLLLITTLFRLALNISSTRLILLEGYAGEVITAFGNFVVGGNAVVGFIVFLILVVIQFVVITKGAERVSEVAARFTLDAMPGKQMAIDADLNQGAISDAEAKRRREKIQAEASFYGAMDGASKFVKGDAIASIIITLINIGGGFIIGMLMRNLSAMQALQTYTLLTVGDGLVGQIAALLISTATGIIVTRSASEGDNLGSDLVSQLFRNPRVFFIACGVLTLLAVVPGLRSGFFGGAHRIFSPTKAGNAGGADRGAETTGSEGKTGGDKTREYRFAFAGRSDGAGNRLQLDSAGRYGTGRRPFGAYRHDPPAVRFGARPCGADDSHPG